MILFYEKIRITLNTIPVTPIKKTTRVFTQKG